MGHPCPPPPCGGGLGRGGGDHYLHFNLELSLNKTLIILVYNYLNDMVFILSKNTGNKI
jgi:hypothetical protein